MEENIKVGDLILRGGVINSIDANTPFEVYEQIKTKIKLPKSVTPDILQEGLSARERVLSTAVGRGIALPHCRDILLSGGDEQQITVVYLKEPIDMNAPDGRKVDTMFVLLTSNSQSHLQVLSRLAGLIKDDSFVELLRSRASAEELADAANKI
ncbi:MAG: PTS sugar transporter subunit IIA [Treponema sp.]|nr:PTS sugar transporter subunit IIA [Treponema sp.]MBQ7619880.1 PTS sugar transporter subunit IIA [Treponema sp.]MBQ9627019.1 PTS sugar transporter subunit IIA [Treponema sp.]